MLRRDGCIIDRTVNLTVAVNQNVVGTSFTISDDDIFSVSSTDVTGKRFFAVVGNNDGFRIEFNIGVTVILHDDLFGFDFSGFFFTVSVTAVESSFGNELACFIVNICTAVGDCRSSFSFD